MEGITACQQSVSINKLQFLGAMCIYIEKPHILNRRISGAVDLWMGSIESSLEFNAHVKVFLESLRVKDTASQDNADDGKFTKKSNQNDDLSETLCHFVSSLEEIGFSKMVETVSEKDHEADESSGTLRVDQVVDSYIVIVRKLLPKQVNKFPPILEVILLDGREGRIAFIGQQTEGHNVTAQVPYGFHILDGNLYLVLLGKACQSEECVKEDASLHWLKTRVAPKLAKWAQELPGDGQSSSRGSLQLVDVQAYSELYQVLKLKYGKPLVEMWPETTDPLKFVYEDVAIATYLLLLWAKQRKKLGSEKKQSFVDLGCGNGLLVYILSSEGHPGLGIDIKKRKIWDLFPSHVKLKEDTVEPSDKNLFPEYDWLIGNHSDELTPWLPVIATKSSFTTSFFVIPCCAHDFDAKYIRQRAGLSQYSDYLEYVKEISSVCGFNLWQDKLRIPSTKRICFVGQERNYSQNEIDSIKERIDEYINTRCKLSSKCLEAQGSSLQNYDSSSSKSDDIDTSESSQREALWLSSFKPRADTQPVRNCTRLAASVKEDLISSISSFLLEKKNILEIDNGTGKATLWNRGGHMTLGSIAERLTDSQRKMMKSECGGLQTFLRNHKHIFSITDGQVQLQVPTVKQSSKVAASRIKTKSCWFFSDHPDSCPLTSEHCAYAHGNNELVSS